MNRDELLRKVKETIHEVEPGAEVILYGSRSRGDEGLESDWDFLILVDGSVDDQRTDNIRHHLYEIEWESGEIISTGHFLSFLRKQESRSLDITGFPLWRE
ncbi:MAG: nucleotidyltransferase domain-containing protein [bacterium]